MAKLYKVLLGVLILHISVSAAPSDVEKVDDNEKVEKTDQKLEGEAISLLNEAETDGSQNQRQKRWYNGLGFQPFATGYFSSSGKRVDSFNTGFDFDDPFVEIHRRLQDISNIVKQPSPPPQFPSFSSTQFPSSNQFPTPNTFPPSNQFPILNQFPFYLPVFYIPQEGCSCQPTNPTDESTPTVPGNEVTPAPNKTKTDNNMTPATPSRLPDLSNERQNDLDNNETEDEEEEGEDIGRPISFDPIIPKRPMSRPPPPVEHGSIQGSVNTGTNTPLPEAAGAPPGDPTTNPFPTPSTPTPLVTDPPNACESAVLSCCHQLQVTYDCFASQGCPDPTSLGNPCDSSVILRVIDRFQRFYGQRTG